MKIDARKQKDGYNQIHDMISKSRDVKQLKRAVENAMPLIQEFQLDAYQIQKLEEFGMKKYENFLASEMRMQHEIQSNRRF
jgi:hypothetical protein